jgi:soluble lytic murein transglycosylase-like protein
MRTTTQRLMLRGGLLLGAALLVSTVGGLVRGATANDKPAPLTGTALLSELRSLRQELDSKQGELDVARLQLARANAVIGYSTQYKITADLAAAIYDIALSEQINPGLAFPLVKLESNFNLRATSKVGALGLTQVMASTARLYEPSLTIAQIYDRDTNLRLGFRYLRDLLERYEGNLERALLAYNRGPARVEQLLGKGQDPRNGYSAIILKGYRE